MTIDEWILMGIDNGWAEKFCYTHDSPPMDGEESERYYNDEEVCIPILRIWL